MIYWGTIGLSHIWIYLLYKNANYFKEHLFGPYFFSAENGQTLCANILGALGYYTHRLKSRVKPNMGVMDNFHFPYSIFHIPYSISIMGVMDIFHIPYHILCPYGGEWTICLFPILSLYSICPWAGGISHIFHNPYMSMGVDYGLFPIPIQLGQKCSTAIIHLEPCGL